MNNKEQDEKRQLYSFLVKRFLLTLILVGLAQMVINLAMKSVIVPLIEKIMGMEGLLNGKNLADVLKLCLNSLLVIVLKMIFGAGSVADINGHDGLLGRLFGSELIDALSVINRKMDNTSMGLYALKVLLLLFLLVLIWILPYVIGAIRYSRRVSAKVNELEQKRIKREREFDEQRNLLLSDITHDIKTPITTIAGFSRALADNAVPEGQNQEYLEAVYNKSMRVSELVSLLFEYVKLDSKGYVLNRNKTDFTELVRENIAEVYAEFEGKNFELELDIPDDEIMLNIDRMQLSRAINNILTNTVKYNPEGTKVMISLRLEGPKAILDISDTGVRIQREDAIHIFEPFYRADKARKSEGGNGLGLSISKRIVEMHGGEIYLISYLDSVKHGKVKSFEIRMPVR